MLAYKGLDKNFRCRDFQYEVGKTYRTSEAVLCQSGFHACIEPMDILSYYKDRFAIVEIEDIDNHKNDDSKLCGKKITILKELSKDKLNEVIKESWDSCRDSVSMLNYVVKHVNLSSSESRLKLVKTLLDIASVCKSCKDEQEERSRQVLLAIGYDYIEGKVSLEELKEARYKLWNSATYNTSVAYAIDYVIYNNADAAIINFSYYFNKSGGKQEQQLAIIKRNYPIPPEV